MKTFRTINGTRAARRIPSADERRERRLYWAGVNAVAVAFLLACCVAAGVIA